MSFITRLAGILVLAIHLALPMSAHACPS